MKLNILKGIQEFMIKIKNKLINVQDLIKIQFYDSFGDDIKMSKIFLSISNLN